MSQDMGSMIRLLLFDFLAGLMGKTRGKKMALAKRGFLGDIRSSHKVA